MFRVVEKQLRKIVPITVKNPFARRNVVVSACVFAGCPSHCALITVVCFVAANCVNQTAFVHAECVQTFQAVNKKQEQQNAERPDSGLSDNFPNVLFFRSFVCVEIRLDVAFEIFGKFDDFFGRERLPTEREKQNRKRRKVFGKAFRAKLRGEQNGYEHQKKRGAFGQFAVFRHK